MQSSSSWRVVSLLLSIMPGSVLAQRAELLNTAGGLAAQAAPSAAAATNLVSNGGFERGSEGWTFAAVAAQATGQVAADRAHEGKAAFKLTNKSAFGPNVFGRVFQVVARLDPFTTYRISCWAKGRDVGIAWIGGGPGWYLRQRLPEGTYDWTAVLVEYTTDANPPAFELMVLTESPTAELWVDDVRMEVAKADSAKRNEVFRQLKVQLDQQQERLRMLRGAAKTNANARKDSIVQLGFNVADRFLKRAQSGGPTGRQAIDWTRLQIEEVTQVLNETEQRIARPAAAAAAAMQPWPVGAAVTIRGGALHTRTTGGVEQPFCFYGYGHFGQVFQDLPNFRGLGATLVQDGRVGPSSMNSDRTLGAAARQTLADLKRAGRYGMKVDWLLSPHYFPEWGYAQAPDVRGGGPGFLTVNIDHPVARKVVADFAHKMSAAMKGEPALFSICLSNEPVYDQSGRNQYSRPAFLQYLKERHGSIESLNQLYGTEYKTFEEVAVPGIGLKPGVNENRAYYDWVRFNQKHFAEWHKWMRGILKRNLPDVPTHAKIMVFFAFDRDKLHFGVDPELFCEATDLAGCDAYAFPEGDKAYGWHGHEFFYDLLYSFRRQPVFDSENHIIPDGSTPWHIPATMTRAQFWQGGLHHQWATTTWVWEEPGEPSLSGSIYLRPANVYGAGRAMLELNRFSKEVAAVNGAAPRVALLYSQASMFWEDAYKPTIFSLYSQLSFLGEAVTFVSERQLAEGAAAKVQCIVLPQATHVEDSTVEALRKFVAGGGRLLKCGENNLAYDPYHRPRKLDGAFKESAKFTPQKDAVQSWLLLRDLLAQSGLSLGEVRDAESDQPAWGIEFRTVPLGSKTLIPIINLGREPRRVKLPVVGASVVTDLLSDKAIDGAILRLDPMVPHLLEIAR